MKRKVLLGLSGGVDSAVAAYQLKKEGYDVTCAFMRNWDALANNDILGNDTIQNDICPQEQDYLDAKAVAETLELPLLRVDFVKEYWDDVFTKKAEHPIRIFFVISILNLMHSGTLRMKMALIPLRPDTMQGFYIKKMKAFYYEEKMRIKIKRIFYVKFHRMLYNMQCFQLAIWKKVKYVKSRLHCI